MRNLFVLLALFGLAGIVLGVLTIVQGAAGQKYLGRVLAVYSMGFMGGAPIGSAIVGFAASELGSRTAALIPGVGLALAAIALAILTPLWRYGGEPAEDAA